MSGANDPYDPKQVAALSPEALDAAVDAAVKAFQEAYGQQVDGTISLGEVIFIEGPVRVDAVGGTLELADDVLEVTIPLGAASTPSALVGDGVGEGGVPGL